MNGNFGVAFNLPLQNAGYLTRGKFQAAAVLTIF
jgi:hypothetical protein